MTFIRYIAYNTVIWCPPKLLWEDHEEDHHVETTKAGGGIICDCDDQEVSPVSLWRGLSEHMPALPDRSGTS